jgi:hypothetical protein
MDNAPVLNLFHRMDQPPEKQKFVTPVSLIVDLVLVVAFFLYLYSINRVHVPSTDPKMIALWGALTSACMTGVFWLALQMVRVVFRFQRQMKKK